MTCRADCIAFSYELVDELGYIKYIRILISYSCMYVCYYNIVLEQQLRGQQLRVRVTGGPSALATRHAGAGR
jgi:hypothetical protein